MPTQLEIWKPPRINLVGNTGRATLRAVVGRGEQGPPGDVGPPGAPGGSDAAFAGWVEDTAPSQTRTALLALTGRGEPIVNHGAVGNGTTDDHAAFLAADAAAAANGGGPVIVGPDVYRIDDVFEPSEGNSLQGAQNALAIPLAKNTILLGSATARIKLGGDSQGRGGRHGFFNIDADGTGDPEGALMVTINDQVLNPITVANAPGIGALLYACQNSKILQLAVDQCEDNIVLDGGSGGLTIENLHSTSPSHYGLWIRDSDPGGHAFGYQFGCADILFVKPLVEQYTGSAAALIRIDSGSRLKFEQPGLSVNGQSLTGHVVELTNDDFAAVTIAMAEFTSGNYHGGPTALEKIFYVKGTNTFTGNMLVVNGESFFQQSASVFNTDGPTIGIIDDESNYYAGTVAALFAATGAGSWFHWRKVQRTGVVYALADPAGAWVGHTPIMVRKDTDSAVGSRMYVANDGTLGWPNGTNNVAQVTATPDTANKFVAFSGIKHTGKAITSVTTTTVSSSQALTTDTSAIAPVHAIILNSSGAITSWTLSNPTDGQEIELWITRAAAQTFVWPTNIKWDANTAPSTTPTANTYTVVHLKYIAAAAKWYEHRKRIEGMPTS